MLLLDYNPSIPSHLTSYKYQRLNITHKTMLYISIILSLTVLLIININQYFESIKLFSACRFGHMSGQIQNSFVGIIPNNVRHHIWMLVREKKKKVRKTFLFPSGHKADVAL